MVHVTRHRRFSALVLIAATNFGFFMLPVRLLNSEKAAILVSMLIAVVIAFAIFAVSHLIKLQRLLYKYIISGSLGIAAGAVLFFLLKSSALLTMEWVNSKGKLLLIALNLAAALYLFFSKRKDKQPRPKDEESSQEEPKAAPQTEDKELESEPLKSESAKTQTDPE